MKQIVREIQRTTKIWIYKKFYNKGLGKLSPICSYISNKIFIIEKLRHERRHRITTKNTYNESLRENSIDLPITWIIDREMNQFTKTLFVSLKEHKLLIDQKFRSNLQYLRKKLIEFKNSRKNIYEWNLLPILTFCSGKNYSNLVDFFRAPCGKKLCSA